MKRIYITTLLISLVGLLTLTAQERIYIPALSLPVNGAVDQMPDVVLDWNAVTGGNTGIIKYDVQLDEDPGFPSPVNFETEFLTAVKTSNLLFGGTYYWRVRAKDGSDISGWSETWSFRVIRRVILTNPNDASLQNDTVRIQWSSISGVTEYDYQFDTIYFWKSVPSGQSVTLFGVSVVDDNHAWISAAGGRILFFDGTSWESQVSNTTNDLYSIYFLDANNGWAVGKGGQISYYDGATWATQSSGTTKDLFSVHFTDANNGWAVGKDGVVLHFNGTAWASQFTATRDLNAVFAFDPTHVWAAGKNGLIIFYNGTSWAVQETGGTIKEFLSIGFTSADQGWAVGKTGFFMKYENGQWSIYNQTLSTRDLTSIYFSSPDNGYVVGKNGTLLLFDGVDWSSQSATVTTNLNGVSMEGNTGFLVGENGVIIAYNDEAFTSPLAIIMHAAGTAVSAGAHELYFGKQYYWRVRAKHSLDISEWSGARSFNTRAAVQLDKPNDNAVDQNLNQQLSWKNQMSKFVTYEIQVDEDPAYGSPIYMATSGIAINAEFLKFGTQYNWRVRVLHAVDTSDWSTSWKFTTVNSVILESPANNATDQALSPMLKWKALTGIAGYQVHVATENSFADPLVSIVVPVANNFLIVPIVLEKDAPYYWRVRAVNGLDTSGWSNIWSFRTVPPVGINEPGLGGKLNVYPNPADNIVYIQLKEKLSYSLQLTITDLVGKKVAEMEIIPDSGIKTVPIDVSFLQNGIYLLRIADKESTYTKKLVIRK
jgi:photosystem II stability/assembly factor-like uncharacterized protein